MAYLVETTTVVRNNIITDDSSYSSLRSSRRSSASYSSDDSELTLSDSGYLSEIAPNGRPPLGVKNNLITNNGEEENSINVTDISKKLIGDAFRARIESIDLDSCLSGIEDSFFVADLGVVYHQHLRWINNLPRVEPFYAVKCNGDIKVLKLMMKLGLGFDCASKNEIKTILNLGVDPSKVVYANPCKTSSYLRFAQAQNVRLMTFDNADELHKCKRFYPDAHLLLRIMTDDSSALCQLSVKFGAAMTDTKSLLKLAKQLELNVVGVAFHVGSGATDPAAFVDAVKNARQVFDEAEQLEMPQMTVLDVGGGFEDNTFEESAKVLNSSLDDYFFNDATLSRQLRIIAEPGRFYVSRAFNLATNVIGRRWVNESQGKAMIYLNDGVYGNLNCILFDHQHPIPRVLSKFRDNSWDFDYYGSSLEDKRFEMSVWGPTCDGLDCITKSCELPVAVDVGDWIYFADMGAYTLCAATSFNGFNGQSDVIYVCCDPAAQRYIE